MSRVYDYYLEMKQLGDEGPIMPEELSRGAELDEGQLIDEIFAILNAAERERWAKFETADRILQHLKFQGVISRNGEVL